MDRFQFGESARLRPDVYSVINAIVWASQNDLSQLSLTRESTAGETGLVAPQTAPVVASTDGSAAPRDVSSAQTPTANQQARYLDKTFVEPQYIWKDGQADLDLVNDTIVDQQATRLDRLVNTPRMVPAVTADRIKQTKTNIKAELAASALNEPDIRSAIMPLVSDVWNAVEPQNYHAQIQVGTHPVPFFIDLDTGSSLLWVQSILAEGDQPFPDQSMYKPAQSSSAKNLGQQKYTRYGDGSTVLCSLFQDHVIAGGLVAASQLIGAAPASRIRDKFKSNKSNGLLGLAISPDRLNLVETLKAQGRLKHASLTLVGPRNDPKVAAEIDRCAILQPRGYFVIGSVDPNFYTGEIAWCPIQATQQWIVKLDAVIINGQTAFNNQRALIDTGNSYILTSQRNFFKVQEHIPGSVTDPKRGLTFAFPEKSLQSIEFVFGGRSMKLNRQDFVIGNWEVYGKQGYLSSIQQNSYFPFNDDMWVMGGIFLDNIVTIFDYDGMRVGFADISPENVSAV